MKKVLNRRKHYIYLSIIIVLLSISLVCSACSKNTVVSIGQEFSLNIGQTADLEGDDFSIKFFEVIQDSRCAIGTTCIWAGEVIFVIEITHNGLEEQMTLTQPGLEDWPSRYFYKQFYEITYNITPYPELNNPILKDDYNLELIINTI